MSAPSYIDRPNRPLAVYAVIFMAFLYVPVLLLPLFSFNDGIYVAFPIEGFTTRWYEEMFANSDMHKALLNSLQVGVVAASAATILGIFAAKALTRYRVPGQKPIVAIIMLPLVIPEIILGVSLLILVNNIGLGLSLVSVTLGHILICVPFATAVMISRFEGFDRALDEASADLGENAWWTFWRVTFPLVFPGILSSFLLCFITSFDEFLVAFFLSGSDPTLPVFIYSQLRFPQKLPGTLALGACIIMASFVVLAFNEWLRRRGSQGVSDSGF